MWKPGWCLFAVLFWFCPRAVVGECPTGMVPLPEPLASSCIGQFEFGVQVQKGESWARHPFNYPLDSVRAKYRAVAITQSDSHRQPQAYISQAQALAACSGAGFHLCNVSEWMLGCGGSKGTTYPYGNTFHSHFCNEGNPNPIPRLYPHPTWNYTEMNNPKIDLMNETVSTVGAFAKCTSPQIGSFDMVGNLDEWISDVTSEGHGIFKGGYFVDAKINGPGCLYRTTAHAPIYHDYSLGFRCCWAPH